MKTLRGPAAFLALILLCPLFFIAFPIGLLDPKRRPWVWHENAWDTCERWARA